MAEKRVAKPGDVDFAIWCGVTKEGAFHSEEGQVTYCLSVPKEQVIYFDGRKWDYVLNGLYLPESPEDQKSFQQELSGRGIQSQYGFLDSSAARMNRDLEKKIRKSWERIFDIEDWDPTYIQASIWEIKKEWVRHIVRHGEDLIQVASDMENTFRQGEP